MSKYTVKITREFIYDPESVKEGYRLLYEFKAKEFLRRKKGGTGTTDKRQRED